MTTETVPADTPTDVVSIFDMLETDTAAEENGKWFTDIMGDNSGIDIKLRALGSVESMQVRRRLDRKNKTLMKNGQYASLDVAIKILVEQVAEAVLIGWRGIYDRDKQEIPYSKEAAISLLTKLPKFRDAVVQMATSMDNFRVEQRELAEKN